MRNIEDRVWQDVLRALEAFDWKVVRRAGREAYYTTKQGRRGTLALHEHDAAIWRWHVDHYSIRTHGKLSIVRPTRPIDRPDGGELTCSENELEAVAAWLPSWIAAYSAHIPDGRFPAGPVPLSGAKKWTHGSAWTLEARSFASGLQVSRDTVREAARL